MGRTSKRNSGKAKKKSRKVPTFLPYARGFKVPSKQKKLKAIGFNLNKIPHEYSPILDTESFPPIPRPTSIDDWLADFAEEGQTFEDYRGECSWFNAYKKHRNVNHTFIQGGKTLTDRYPEGKIYIVPMGDFDEESNFVFDDLLDYAKRYLCLPVATLPNLKLKFVKKKLMFGDAVLNTRQNTKPKHLQVQVHPILTELQHRVPHDALFLICLTTYDLYCSDPDLFVAGIAWGCNVAVFSVHRYNPRLTFSPEFWYDISETEDISDKQKKQLILQRSCKLVVHEIGHLLGIGHCIFYSCCMNGSGHLAEDFRQPMHLCPVDLHKLQGLTGFDVTGRYQNLLEFYKKHGMESEADWVERRIRFIQAGDQEKGDGSLTKKQQLTDSE